MNPTPHASRPAPRRKKPPVPARALRSPRRRRSWAAPLLPLAVLCLGLEIGGVLLWSPKFQVHRVFVDGNHVARAEALLDRIDVPCGTPLIRVSPSVLEKKLLDEPSVARASVKTRWPDEVAIHVVERTPTWNVRTAAGWVQADAEGKVFKSVSSPSPSLPILVMAHDRLELGATLPSATLRSSKACLAWARKESGWNLATIDIDPEGRFTLQTRNRVGIRLGTPVKLQSKLDTLALLALEIPELKRGETIEYVNLIASDAPSVRYRVPAVPSG